MLWSAKGYHNCFQQAVTYTHKPLCGDPTDEDSPCPKFQLILKLVSQPWNQLLSGPQRPGTSTDIIMIPTINFLAPSLHPNTLVDLTFPDPGPSSYREPIVRHLAIKHGEHQPLGLAKRMILRPDGSVRCASVPYLS